jgi:hypothetical protein
MEELQAVKSKSKQQKEEANKLLIVISFWYQPVEELSLKDSN